jgi:hypothetical protein
VTWTNYGGQQDQHGEDARIANVYQDAGLAVVRGGMGLTVPCQGQLHRSANRRTKPQRAVRDGMLPCGGIHGPHSLESVGIDMEGVKTYRCIDSNGHLILPIRKVSRR